jgi:hypothetical protein
MESKIIRGNPETEDQKAIRKSKEIIWSNFKRLFKQYPGKWPIAEENDEDAVDSMYDQYMGEMRCSLFAKNEVEDLGYEEFLNDYRVEEDGTT